MNEKFDVKKLTILEKKILELTLNKSDLVEIKVKIKDLKKILKESNSVSLDHKKFILTRLCSLQRLSDRKLQQFYSENDYFPMNLIYSLHFQSLIKNKQLLIYFKNDMIITKNKKVSLNSVAKEAFNPDINSIGSLFIHHGISDVIRLLEGKKIYKDDNMFVIDDGDNYIIEITLKKFYDVGKISAPFKSEIKKIFVENRLANICYIKTVCSQIANKHFFVKENYINVHKIAVFIGHSLENFDITDINLISKRANNLFLGITINKRLFSQENSKSIPLPYRFAHKLINKRNTNFLYKIMCENKKNSPFWENLYSEKDIYSSPLKLYTIKNIILHIAYKLSFISMKGYFYLEIGLEELCSLGLVKETRTSKNYLFNTYLYLKLFIELYEWPDKSLEVFYNCIDKSKIPNIIIKKVASSI